MMKNLLVKLTFVSGMFLIFYFNQPIKASAAIEQVSLLDRPYPKAERVTNVNELAKYNLLKYTPWSTYIGNDSGWKLAKSNGYNEILNSSNEVIGKANVTGSTFYYSLHGGVGIPNLLTNRSFKSVQDHNYQVTYFLVDSSFVNPEVKMKITKGEEITGALYRDMPIAFNTMVYQNFRTDGISGYLSFQNILYSSWNGYAVVNGKDFSILDLDQNIIEARTEVEKLYTDTTYTKLNEFVTQKELDDVKKIVDSVVNAAERNFLFQYTDRAQNLLNLVKMTLVTDELSDNVDNQNSYQVSGKTFPYAYVRIKGNENFPENTLVSPFKSDSENFTLQADEIGNYTVNLENDARFIAEESVTVVSNRHGKVMKEELIVKDKTAPTGKVKTAHSVLKDPVPSPDKFVTELKDSNVVNKKITAEFSGKNSREKVNEMLQKSGNYTVYVNIKDDASNVTEIESELIVYDSNSLLESSNFQIDQKELLSLSKEKTLDRFLKDSQTIAYLIKDTNKIDLINKVQLIGFDSFKKELGETTFKYLISKEDTGLTKDLMSEFIVTVTQPGARKPVDPTNPQLENPIDAENEGTGNVGYLRIDYVPTSFNFGTVKTSFLNKVYQAEPAYSVSGKTLAKQWVQVSDTRLSNHGWTLSVEQSTPFRGSDGSILKGAALTIPKGSIYNTAFGGNPIVDSSIQSQEVELSGTPTSILSTSKTSGTGKNITTNVWEASQVSLYVPGGGAKNKVHYETTLNWLLATEVPN